jgi:hypothetical protein
MVAFAIGIQAWSISRQANIIIEWVTASELNTAGFNVYRSTSPVGPPLKLNAQLIPSSSDPLTGASYKYTDRGLSPGTTYYYFVEEIESDGTQNRYEAIQVTADSGGKIEAFLAMIIFGIGITGLLIQYRNERKREVA